MTSRAKRIAVTGAAGQICYSLLFRIAKGDVGLTYQFCAADSGGRDHAWRPQAGIAVCDLRHWRPSFRTGA